jgi:biopolymer transport protein ExbD
MALGKVPGGGNDLDEEGIFAEINITPLTDIFLVLLIIFMVTSSVMADAGARSGMRVNLPKGAMREVNTQAQDITILITADGKLVIKGKTVDAAELAQLFNEAKQRSPDTQLIVQADESTHHGRVVSVMELAKSSGLHRLAIATRRSK